MFLAESEVNGLKAVEQLRCVSRLRHSCPAAAVVKHEETGRGRGTGNRKTTPHHYSPVRVWGPSDPTIKCVLESEEWTVVDVHVL